MQSARWLPRPGNSWSSGVVAMVLAALLATALPSATVARESSATATPGSVSVSAIPAGAITPRQAARNVGRTKTVCGKVASATYARYSNGRPTFLNLGRAYPNQIFTIVIWSEYRSRYRSAPEKMFRNKTVCVNGRIGTYRGTPQIEARSNVVWKP